MPSFSRENCSPSSVQHAVLGRYPLKRTPPVNPGFPPASPQGLPPRGSARPQDPAARASRPAGPAKQTGGEVRLRPIRPPFSGDRRRRVWGTIPEEETAQGRTGLYRRAGESDCWQGGSSGSSKPFLAGYWSRV